MLGPSGPTTSDRPVEGMLKLSHNKYIYFLNVHIKRKKKTKGHQGSTKFDLTGGKQAKHYK